MRWSIPAGSLFGIPIKIHVTLLLLLIFLVPTIGADASGEVDILFGFGVVTILFGSVLAHEFGHALVARRYGVRTREIVLLPIGGVAVLADEPDTPLQEMWIALAGPLTSIALCGVAFGLRAAGGPEFLGLVSGVNLVLGVFNLLPAFPLDGGRVLRAGLAHKLGAARATVIAARIGRVLAIAMVVFGVMNERWGLTVIGVFVFIAARKEERQSRLREVLRSQRVSDWMEPVVRIFNATTPTSEIEAQMTNSDQGRAFPVTFGDEILGVVHRQPVLDALERGLRLEFLHQALDRNVVTIAPDALLEDVFRALARKSSQAAVVVDEQQAVMGVLTVERLSEALGI
jgi:Zn-dependent protease/CBS domain-containing protein